MVDGCGQQLGQEGLKDHQKNNLFEPVHPCMRLAYGFAWAAPNGGHKYETSREITKLQGGFTLKHEFV